MKAHLGIIIIFVIVFLGLQLGVDLTQAKQGAGATGSTQASYPAALPWKSQYIQQRLSPPLDVGQYVSIALRSFDNLPVISYYDSTNGNLMVASPVLPHNGNCGTDDTWYCHVVDGVGEDVGKYSSIDTWGDSPDNWKAGISYYDVTNRALKVALVTCDSIDCNWTLDTVSFPEGPWDIGLYSSFKFDPTGTPAVAFQLDQQYGSDYLMYAYPVPLGGDCPLNSDWKCVAIDFGNGIGRYISLDFNYADQPYIAYNDGNAGDLKLARYQPGNCGSDNDWLCSVLDGEDGSNVGQFASLTAPQSAADLFRIAYYDKTNGQLKYIDSSGWKLVVDDMGTSLAPMGISMALDKDGYPVIAYQRISSDLSPATLRIARPYLVYNDGDNGNCGDLPPGYLFQYWRCTTIDNASEYSTEAVYASMAVTSHGLVGIAYTEYDSFFDATSLKFTYQALLRTFLPGTIRQ